MRVTESLTGSNACELPILLLFRSPSLRKHPVSLADEIDTGADGARYEESEQREDGGEIRQATMDRHVYSQG